MLLVQLFNKLRSDYFEKIYTIILKKKFNLL